MFSHLVLFLTLLSAFGARLVRAQTPARCLDGYNWMFNERGQSPCDMAGYLYSVCKDDPITVLPLQPDHYYSGPENSTYATLCACSTVTWSLFSACAACQNRTTAAWNVWDQYCATTLEMTFPFDIPSQTVIPRWAYLNCGAHWMWDAKAAKAAYESAIKKSVPVGAIVGGVIGGLVLLATLIGIYLFIRHRRAAARPPAVPETTSLPPSTPTSPSIISEPSVHQRLYNPSDPATFPPANYGPSSTTHTTSPSNSPGYGQSPYSATTVVF